MARPKNLQVGDEISSSGKINGQKRKVPPGTIIIISVSKGENDGDIWPTNSRIFFTGEVIEPANYSDCVIRDIVLIDKVWNEEITKKIEDPVFEKIKALGAISNTFVDEIRQLLLVAYCRGYRCEKDKEKTAPEEEYEHVFSRKL